MRAVYRGNLKDQRRIQEHRGLCEYNIEQNLRLQAKLREMAVESIDCEESSWEVEKIGSKAKESKESTGGAI